MRELKCGLPVVLSWLLILSAATGPCVKDEPCSGGEIGTWLEMCCVWDHGCYLNPLEPDGQYWCQRVRLIKCTNGKLGWYTIESFECGPCCDPEPVTP